MRGAWAVAVVALVAVALVAAPVAGAAGSGAQGASAGALPADRAGTAAGHEFDDAVFQTGAVDPDAVTIRAEVEPDGDAAWTVEYRVRLGTDNETEAFRSLQADVRNNTTAYVDRFARRLNATVATAENATGREMAAGDYRVSTRIQRLGSDQFGFVTYRFNWANFAVVEGDRVVAGDAVAGLYLDGSTTFVVAWPENYSRRQAAPTPVDIDRENAVGWRGERSFGTGQPTVAVAPERTLPASPVVLAGVAAVLVVGGAGFVLRRERLLGDRAATASGAADAEAGEGSAAAAESEGNGDSAAAETGTGPGTESGSGTEADADGDEPSEGEDGPPEELLSPQERVLRLLGEHGGRMKQKDVTEAMDWSAARTSQVVGDLREDGAVETFRLGRENVLRLPEEDDDLGPDG
ncbi:MAG: helix-turn-helix transcriptional regulator [Halolamina sp.]